MTSDARIDDRPPIGNFLTDRFSALFQSDRDTNGGGIMLYVREGIPVNILSTENVL